VRSPRWNRIARTGSNRLYRKPLAVAQAGHAALALYRVCRQNSLISLSTLFRRLDTSMPSPRLKPLHWLLLGCFGSSTAQAVVYPLPSPDTEVIGQVRVVYANQEDTLLDIARRNSLGYDEIVHANPGVDRWVPGTGTPIVLPTRYILPDTPRDGVVLNIPEMRLYYYPKTAPGEQAVVHTYPVSIGRMDWKTPQGSTKVVAKDVDPPWRPPASIKAEHAKEGDILPDVIPGGPDNPLGRFALRLGIPGYLIHSTNKPFGIGMRVTHGCVRMYPEDIERFFPMVPIGTTVRIVDQPVKVGRLDGALFVESHAPLEEDNLPMKVTLEQARQEVADKVGPEMPGVDQNTLAVAVEQVSGIPVEITGHGEPAAREATASLPPPSASPVPTPTPIPEPVPAPAMTPAPPPRAPVAAARTVAPAPLPPATAAAPVANTRPPAPGNYPPAQSAQPTYRPVAPTTYSNNGNGYPANAPSGNYPPAGYAPQQQPAPAYRPPAPPVANSYPPQRPAGAAYSNNGYPANAPSGNYPPGYRPPAPGSYQAPPAPLYTGDESSEPPPTYPTRYPGTTPPPPVNRP
jgi:L,D-transpeptidase ErfK/SrfK